MSFASYIELVGMIPSGRNIAATEDVSDAFRNRNPIEHCDNRVVGGYSEFATDCFRKDRWRSFLNSSQSTTWVYRSISRVFRARSMS